MSTTPLTPAAEIPIPYALKSGISIDPAAVEQPHHDTFLMCPPRHYDVHYVINPWMVGNVHASSRELAAAQWQRLHEVVSQIANVVLVEPQPGSPDMVFTANAGLERDGIVVLSSFFHPERQAEESHFRRWFQTAGYTVHTVTRETPFEGEGDALFAFDGSRLWAANGPRSVLASHHHLAAAWNVEVTALDLIDPRFYHLDTCFAPLSDGSAMYYPGAFSQRSIQQIESIYPPEKRILVTEEDAIRFACNVVNVGRTLILNQISAALSNTLASRGFQVIPLDLSEFLKAGGAAKCLVMKLSRTQAT